MKQIKIKQDFTIGGEYYFKGDTIDPDKLKYEQVVKLNEKGYIEPLTLKEVIEIKNGNKTTKKEEKE